MEYHGLVFYKFKGTGYEIGYDQEISWKHSVKYSSEMNLFGNSDWFIDFSQNWSMIFVENFFPAQHMLEVESKMETTWKNIMNWHIFDGCTIV